jgi:hypothetical protein
MEDIIKIVGSFHAKIFKMVNGLPVCQFEIDDPNKVVTLGKGITCKLLANDGVNNFINKIYFGTSNIIVTAADTTITDPFSKDITDYEFPSDTSVKFNFMLELTDPDKVVKEYGLMSNAGELFARKVGTPIDKKGDIFIEGAWTITFI